MTTSDVIAIGAAAFTLAGVVVSLWALYVADQANKATVINNSVNLTLQLKDQFENPAQMLPKRRQAAQALLAAWQKETPTRAQLQGFFAVADFFDTLGLWVRTEALNPEMAWSVFWVKASYYWEISEGKFRFVTWVRDQYGDKTVWQDFQRLVAQLDEVQAGKLGHHGRGPAKPSNDMLENFLRAEVHVGLPEPADGMNRRDQT